MSKKIKFKNLKFTVEEFGIVDPEEFFESNNEVELKKIRCNFFENKNIKWNLPKITVQEFKELIDTILNQEGKEDSWIQILHSSYEGLLLRLEYYIKDELLAVEFNIPKH
ncbi:MAG: hypothetical protein ACLU4S_02615 [Clostridium perfringens]